MKNAEIHKEEPLVMSRGKNKTADIMDSIAAGQESYIKKNSYYYHDLIKLMRFTIPEGSSVLEIGCGTGYVLHNVHPSRGIGIDISPAMIARARNTYPQLTFYCMDAENIPLNEKYDYVIISDSLGYFEDIQKAFQELKKVCHATTRIIITFHNFLWQPFLKIAERFRLKMRQPRLNWLNETDIQHLLYLEDFDIIKSGQRLLVPKYVPFLSRVLNRYLANLPPFNHLCLTRYLIARLGPMAGVTEDKDLSVSVIIPARNEMGNIENAITRIPEMGNHTEIIFVEGHSTDNTLQEIKAMCKKYSHTKDIKYTVQAGMGKGDAVRKGFAMALGDILMIQDADLTAPPEDLPKFYDALASGKGEFINGSRLVYPMEKQAMQTLNIIANKIFSLLFSWLLGQSLKDTLCGTKVISKKNWERLAAGRSYFGDFDPFGDFDLIFGSAKMNLKIIEIPVRYKAREYGNTNISRFKHGWLLLKMVSFALNKMKFT